MPVRQNLAEPRHPAQEPQPSSPNASGTAPLLEIRKLAKRYGSFQALDGVDLTMRPGEIISVLGPSGCGKSTLLQLIAGLASPDDGEIAMDGAVISSRNRLTPPERRGVNMVFQDYALWPHMTVKENIEYGMKRMKLSRDEMGSRLDELMRLLRLQGLERRLPPQLSGGQQQRVAIARALATRPRLMLLDEPLSNLDMRLRVEMRTEMAYLFRKLGTSVFHVTHDPDEAFAMADRLLIMRGGRIDQLGTPEQCFRRPASRWSASLLGAINSLEGIFAATERGYALSMGGANLLHGLPDPGAAPGANSALLGKPGVILFRPESVSVEAGGNAGNLNGGQDDPVNRLTVTIVHCSFEGVCWRAVAETSCGQRLYIVHENPLPAGECVTIGIKPDSAYMYRNEDER
jgi:iron(III) transport system ATP-binding protein/putative spermidine/putrescine transport system ATP-binding protein